MIISYKWLQEYLPIEIEPERLSKILTSVGLEVEALESYESVKGSLNGLIIGEVISCEQHPNADKLKLTTVNIGTEMLQIVCGASNVAIGQKVVVAIIGTTIYPTNGEPFTIKNAKIRGIESNGMICAEDEIGLGNNHDGIIVLPNDIAVGTTASEYFNIYSDWVFHIGLTPNRMDAMSHLGVAKDICAYLTHHEKQDAKPKFNSINSFKADTNRLIIDVKVENTDTCLRYSGLSISNIEVKPSPDWLKNKLKSIGQKSINNIVDITNYILHESGQPLHAFDADKITGKTVLVKNLIADTLFISLDEKERKLTNTDLMICDAESNPMCIAGVFGGLNSGVSNATTNIFLESACFQSAAVRKSSLYHGLRTEAAIRFEKGVDISNTLTILKRAAILIKEIAGGEISSDIIDIYPNPKEKTEIAVKYHYIKKLSGKNYHPDAIRKILTALGFEIIKEGMDEIRVSVPFNKPDITLPADIVEEIVRIDGLDNIPIPASITLTPSVENNVVKTAVIEKIASYLTGQGFYEILTNSISNSTYYRDIILNNSVRMLNSLNVDLNVLRPTMLYGGLESIAYNINRKKINLLFFELGKTYHSSGIGHYSEDEHIALFLTGNNHADEWRNKSKEIDFFTSKGIVTAVLQICGIQKIKFIQEENSSKFQIYSGKELIGDIYQVAQKELNLFDIKQDVFFIDLNTTSIISSVENNKITYKEVPKFPAMQRDLALVVNSSIKFMAIEQIVEKQRIKHLQSIRLFDIYESDKLGNNKKSLAVNLTFQDEDKTLTDKDIDGIMNKLIHAFEKELEAEIRK